MKESISITCLPSALQDIISAEFIHKLESLLQRAYRLQEEFEASLGAADPASFANDIGECSCFYICIFFIESVHHSAGGNERQKLGLEKLF